MRIGHPGHRKDDTRAHAHCHRADGVTDAPVRVAAYPSAKYPSRRCGGVTGHPVRRTAYASAQSSPTTPQGCPIASCSPYRPTPAHPAPPKRSRDSLGHPVRHASYPSAPFPSRRYKRRHRASCAPYGLCQRPILADQPLGCPGASCGLIGPHQPNPRLRNTAGAALGILRAMPPIPEPLSTGTLRGRVTGHPVRRIVCPSETRQGQPWASCAPYGLSQRPIPAGKPLGCPSASCSPYRPTPDNPRLRNAAGAALGILRAPTPCTGPDVSPVGTPIATAPRRRRG